MDSDLRKEFESYREMFTTKPGPRLDPTRPKQDMASAELNVR